jgi:hypothetical protein
MGCLIPNISVIGVVIVAIVGMMRLEYSVNPRNQEIYISKKQVGGEKRGTDRNKGTKSCWVFCVCSEAGVVIIFGN